MLDIKFIRENKKIIEEVLKNKKVKGVDLEHLFELDKKRRTLINNGNNIPIRR